MSSTFLRTCGVPIVALALGLSLAATPAMAGPRAAGGGGGGFHGGGMGGGFHGGGMAMGGGFHGGGWHGGHGMGHSGGWNGGRYAGGYGGYGYGGGYGGYGYGYGDGYGYGLGDVGLGLGLGLVGGAILGSQYPYDDYGAGYTTGYVTAPQVTGGNSVAYCESQFKSYDAATGTYLGYDGMRHACP